MKYLMFILLLIFFYGCDPGYHIYISNKSSKELLILTSPSIESLYDPNIAYYDSILNHKLKEENGISTYSIRPYEQFRVFGNIGGIPTLKDLPFNYIKIVQEKDTLVLNSKEKILKSLIRENKKINHFYFKFNAME